MSFVKNNIHLTGNLKQPVHPPKHCSKCNQERVPEGGVEMGPSRWVCAACWTHRTARRPTK